MKKLSLFVGFACIILLCGCSVKHTAKECVADILTISEPAKLTMDVSVPDDAVPLSQTDSMDVLYDQGDYVILKETYAAASAQEGLEQMTGFPYSSLNPLRLSDFPYEKYYLSWTGTGEQGCDCCYGVLLFDGSTCYTVQIRCPEEIGCKYQGTILSILSNVKLKPV